MKPDPWQQKKSRKYQAKHRAASGKDVKTAKMDDGEKDSLRTSTVQSKVVGGFKFVAPPPLIQTGRSLSEEGSDADGKYTDDEYDVSWIGEDFDLSSLAVALPSFDKDLSLPVRLMSLAFHLTHDIRRLLMRK